MADVGCGMWDWEDIERRILHLLYASCSMPYAILLTPISCKSKPCAMQLAQCSFDINGEICYLGGSSEIQREELK
jgi:hypothetical protein